MRFSEPPVNEHEKAKAETTNATTPDPSRPGGRDARPEAAAEMRETEV